MHCCYKAHCIHLLSCAQVRGILPSLRLLPHNHHYMGRSVSDLAQVLNNTSSELCRALNSVDASAESTAFAGRLNESFASLIQPYRYTSYEISSSFRPTTMLFGCALPDDLGSASNGQRAVVKAFETILCSAAEKHPQSLYQAICDAHKRQGNDVKQVKYFVVFLCAMFLTSPLNSQHSNWNRYGTHLRNTGVWQL